jgi:CHAT domain-containing protein/tetratricopeptide (TPR) repeat protein
LKEGHLGPEHVETAQSLYNLGTVHLQRGEFSAALQPLERSLSIRTAAIGLDDPAVADSLDQFALSLIQLDRFQEAEQRLAESQRIRERRRDESSLALARTLELVAWLHRTSGNYAAATSAINRAMALRRSGPRDHPDMVLALQVQGDVLLLTGDASGAQQAWFSALVLAERTLRHDHPSLVELLRRLGIAASSLGNLADARRLAERARDVGDRSLAPCDPARVGLAIALGDSLRYDAEYAEARRLYRSALIRVRDCVKAGNTRASSDVEATLVFNDASVARDVGDLAEADALYEQAVDIWSKGLGPDHPFVATGMDALAEVVAARGQLKRARELYERALASRQRRLGPAHPQVAWTLTNLAETVAYQGQVSAALRYLDEAIAIYRKARAPYEPDHFARVLELQGVLETKRGNLGTARAALLEALNERTRIFGDSHPLVAKTLAAVAVVDLARGDESAALTAALDAERLGREQLLFTVRYLPERQAMTYAAKRPRGLDLSLSIAEKLHSDHARVFDAVIRSRGVILDEFAAARRRATSSSDPEVASLMAASTAARQRFANLVMRSLQEPVSRELLDEARKQKDEAERALAARNVEARAEQSRASAGLDDIRRALPSTGMIVSFVKYERTRVVAGGQAVRPSDPEPSYAAFIVKSGSRHTAFVPLGSAASLDGIIKAWRAEASGQSIARGTPTSSAQRSYEATAARLRRAVWEPLLPHMTGASRIFVVPDGLLNLVNLASLPDGDGYLAERDTLIHYLTTERDLLLPEREAGGRNGLLTVGGPAFDEGPAPPVAAARRGSECQSLAHVQFSNLPGSLSEIAEIGSLWPRTRVSDVTLLSGPAATETAVKKAVTGRRVVHLATHGFVLGADCGSNPAGVRAVGGLARSGAAALAAADNPLLLTGLALAGANQRSAAALDQDDGLLTAEEIAGLNLQGTEWAVLSACDTGLGEIRAGEGVFGLRRAFQIAGARTVIMSLWSVEDDATRVWMRALYEGRLKNKLGTADAVRAASLAVLRERRAKGQSTHPFYWAAFVAAGDWR